MQILIVLIPLGLMLLGVALVAFVWAVRHDQFENLESEGSRILMDDDDECLADAPASLRVDRKSRWK